MNARTNMTLPELADLWLTIKAEENRAVAARREVEELIVALMPKRDEGSVSEEALDIKVTATFKLNRTVDAAALQAQWNDLPEIVHDAFTWKPELVMKQVRALEAANPVAYSVLAGFITTSPAKPALKIERKL